MESKEEREARALKEHKRMSILFKENRFMFELEAKKKREELIMSAPPEQQPKLKEMQADWDKTMKGAGSKGNRLVLAEHKLMEHFRNVFHPAMQWAYLEFQKLTGKIKKH